MILPDGDLLLRWPVEIVCENQRDAREFHERYPATTELVGKTVKFLRSVRVPKPKPKPSIQSRR